jgi:ADP-ribose pyrophosphatase YjhB (NUDIX family)
MAVTTDTTTVLFQPRVGCGAAIIRGAEILLVRRVREPEAGHWGLPGGKVDPFEPLRTAAAREIAEELGIEIAPETLLCVVDQIDLARGQHWVSPVYLVERFEGDPSILEPQALSDMGWFPIAQPPHPLTTATVQALAALRSNKSSRP